MKEIFRNPHPFDMSNYFSGHTYMVGGRDFDHEEKDTNPRPQENDKKITYKLDWSFLKTSPQTRPTKRF